MIHPVATCGGATCMIDNVIVFDDGVPTTPTVTTIPSPTATVTAKPCVKGDADCNNSITPGDALLAFQIYLLTHQITNQESCDVRCACDTDNNDSITPGDALCIFNMYLGNQC